MATDLSLSTGRRLHHTHLRPAPAAQSSARLAGQGAKSQASGRCQPCGGPAADLQAGQPPPGRDLWVPRQPGNYSPSRATALFQVVPAGAAGVCFFLHAMPCHFAARHTLLTATSLAAYHTSLSCLMSLLRWSTRPGMLRPHQRLTTQAPTYFPEPKCCQAISCQLHDKGLCVCTKSEKYTNLLFVLFP